MNTALQLDTLSVGPLSVNCYIIRLPASRRALIIDPGDDPEEIIAAVEQSGCTPLAILLTHGHFDHIRGLPGVARAFPVPIVLHPADHALYHSPENAMPPWAPRVSGLPEVSAALPPCPGFDLEILPTPGHTPGSVSIHFPAARLLFSGDTLFCGGVGRTDLPGGDAEALVHSIRQVLYPLPRDTRVFPGHYQPSSIGAEQDSNPFVPGSFPAAHRSQEKGRRQI